MTSRTQLRNCILVGVGIMLSACNHIEINHSSSADNQLKTFFDRSYQQDLARSPMMQTYRGVKDDYDRWDDLSEAFLIESETINEARLTALAHINYKQLSESSRLSADIYQQVLQRQQHASAFRHHPYIMQQFKGWHTKVPSFLINMHQITAVSDAKAYIWRIYRVQQLMENVLEQLTIRQQKGIYPPRWSYPQMLSAANNVLTGRPFDNSNGDSALLADFRGKVNKLAIDDLQKRQLIKDAEAALLNALLPSYRLLINTLTAQMKVASTDDGVWKLPNGEAYYQQLLNYYTTTELTADNIHELGLEQVKRIHSEMRNIMKAVNFQGDLAAFFTFMREDRQFYYPSTSEGRKQYLANVEQKLAAMENKLPTMFSLLPKAELSIKPVEAFRERSAGKAFYQSPSQDGSRPGIYYANLYQMNSMPSYQLEALAYHEGLPGHHMQRAITVELDEVPNFQKYSRFTAYTEGWGLYAEYLAKEMGAYSDPYSDFGRLTMELWRACRLVVDTGLHAKRWTRQQAIDYLVANTPNSVADSTKAIERYIVYPGQATAYLIGKIKILELRESAKTELGEAFDIKEFHNEVLKDGPVPLSLLEAKIQRWVESKL